MAQKKSPLFTLFKGDVTELPSVRRFKADEEFVVSRHSIGRMSSDFKNLIAGVVECNIGKGVVETRELARMATIKEINKAIGERGTFSLAHLSALLDSQTQSFITIILVRGKFWAGLASWGAGDGWRVYAVPVDYPDPWDGGFQVLSRKSAKNLVRQ